MINIRAILTYIEVVLTKIIWSSCAPHTYCKNRIGWPFDISSTWRLEHSFDDNENKGCPFDFCPILIHFIIFFLYSTVCWTSIEISKLEQSPPIRDPRDCFSDPFVVHIQSSHFKLCYLICFLMSCCTYVDHKISWWCSEHLLTIHFGAISFASPPWVM